MSVVFDASILIDLFYPRTPEERKLRLDHLVEELQQQRTVILIPTPALAEFLVKAGPARDEYLSRIETSKTMRIVSFGKRAAVEYSIAIDAALRSGDKRRGSKSIWSKVKFDHQIVCIAVGEGAKTIYTEDGDIQAFGKQFGISTIKTLDLPLPASAAQGRLQLEPQEPPRRINVRHGNGLDESSTPDP